MDNLKEHITTFSYFICAQDTPITREVHICPLFLKKIFRKYNLEMEIRIYDVSLHILGIEQDSKYWMQESLD